jgi:hypothetical protein
MRSSRFRVLARALAWALALALGLCAAGPARADIIVLTNPNQFSGSETVLTFAGVQPFQNVTSYQGVGFQLVGAPAGTGPSGAFDPSPPRQFGPPEGTIIQTLFEPAGAPARDLQITFPSSVNRVGFELKTSTTPLGNNISISLLSGGSLVDAFTLPQAGTGQQYLFYGFQSTNPFDQVVLRGPGDNDRRLALDNLRFELAPGSVVGAAVPEPSGLLLGGILGVVGLAYRRFNRRGVN